MTQSNPTVTVLIAMYNEARYIEEAVKSVLSQSYQDYEILIIDDGSTDRSGEIISKINDDRIRIVKKQNTGVAHSRKIGVESAKGKYIAILDADDLFMPNRLSSQVEYLNNNLMIGGIAGEAIFITQDDKVIGKTNNYRLASNYIEALASKETGFIHTSFMFRKNAMLSIGNYDEYFVQCEDLDLVLRLGEKYQVIILPEYNVKVRRRSNSYSHISSLPLKSQWYYGALASVNYYRRKNGLKNLHSPEEKESLSIFDKCFAKSDYYRNRLARQKIYLSRIGKKRSAFPKMLYYLFSAFRIYPLWFVGTQAKAFKKLLNGFMRIV